MTNRYFVPNWKILILSALLLPVLLLLGSWQLDRAEEKQQILAELESRSSLPARPIEQLLGKADTRYQPVTLRGRFDNQHSFLLDNRVRQGIPGYEVITPFVSNSGQWLLVNRGWMAAPRYRHQLPEIPVITHTVNLAGVIHTPLAKSATVYDGGDGWPKVIQALNFEQMSSALPQPVAPLTIRLREGEMGSFQVGWPAINVQPHKHTAYAVQWFLMALALLILTLISNFRRVDHNNDKQ